MEIGISAIDGVGVFSVRSLFRGTHIAHGLGAADYKEIIKWSDARNCSNEIRSKIYAFCIGTPEGFLPPDKLDFNRLTIEWYLNHSCDGNVGFDEHGDFVARRRIRKGEELTYDYGLAESNPRFRMRCRCGTVSCRSIITGDDWKDAEFRERNLAFMLPRLRRSTSEEQPIEAPRRRVATRHR